MKSFFNYPTEYCITRHKLIARLVFIETKMPSKIILEGIAEKVFISESSSSDLEFHSALQLILKQPLQSNCKLLLDSSMNHCRYCLSKP